MTAPQTLDDLAGEGLGLFRPAPEILPSQWADQTRRLSSESSAEPGAWDTSRAEYQRGMMDAVAEAEAAKVVLVTVFSLYSILSNQHRPNLSQVHGQRFCGGVRERRQAAEIE